MGRKREGKIPKMIKNVNLVNNLFDYIRKTIVVQSNLCQWMQLPDSRKIKIIKCDLGQSMLCVIEEKLICPKSQNGKKIEPFYRSELIDFGFSADILAKYGISNNAIPPSFRES